MVSENDVSPYIQHILDAAIFVEKYHFSSFDTAALAKLQTFRHLTPAAQHYIARVSLRKGTWQRSEKTVTSMPRGSEVSEFIDTLTTLISMSIVEPLNNSLSTDIIWEAITECLIVDELQALHQLIAKSRCRGYITFRHSV